MLYRFSSVSSLLLPEYSIPKFYKMSAAPPACTVCLENYDPEIVLPMTLSCGHAVCVNCLKGIADGSSCTCPMCRERSKVKNAKKNYALIEVLPQLGSNKTKDCQICNQLMAHEEAWCCRTCQGDRIDSNRSVSAFCANCSLRQHNGHEVTPYFPICLKLRTSDAEIRCSTEIDKLTESLDGAMSLMTESLVTAHRDMTTHCREVLAKCTNFKEYKEEYNTLMVRLSKITKVVETLTEDVREAADKMKQLHKTGELESSDYEDEEDEEEEEEEITEDSEYRY